MATAPTDPRRRAAYVRFEVAVDEPKTTGAKTLARSRAGRRYANLAVAEREQLGNTILAVEDAQREVEACAGHVKAWNPDTQAAPLPTTVAQRDAQQVLLEAYRMLRQRLYDLRALQRRLDERAVAITWTDQLLTRSRAALSALSAAQRATDGQATPPATPATPVPALPNNPPRGSPVGAGWVGSWRIGTGAFGMAFLWVRQDHNNRIMDRVVTKDSTHDDILSQEKWRMRWFWSKDRDEKLIPTEIKTLYDLRGRRSAEYIVEIRGWRQSIYRKMHRQYLEYCAGGDAWRLYGKGDYRQSDTWIPEPFIWYCAEALATAGLIMLYGDTIPNPVSEWRPILHRDWKTGNILLGEKQPHLYAAYPTPKVCDFGLATYNLRDGDHTFATDGGVGTPGCTAPEQHRDGLGAHTSKSDVWNVGCSLLSLMLKTDGLPSREAHDMARDWWEPGWEQGTWEGVPCSEDLIELVNDCMRFDQDQRPTFTVLLRRIQDARTQHNEGLHSEPENGAAWSLDNALRLGVGPYLQMNQICRDEVKHYEHMRRLTRGPNDSAEFAVHVPPALAAGAYGPDDDVRMGGVPGGDIDA